MAPSEPTRSPGFFTEETLSILRRALGSDNESVRGQAAEILGRMGQDGRAAVPDLLQALGVGHWMTRAAIAEALAVIGPDEPGVRAALRAALSEPRVCKMTYRARDVALGRT
jgi:HEAT repeat protein